MDNRIKEKLSELPSAPGVYFHKDASGQIIYIGKAAVLRNRVRQYFQSSRSRDAKTEALIAEITDVDWMVVDSEIEALFLEAEMIRRYMPKYNILLRDDKSMIYIRIDYNSDYPTVTTTRRPLDDGARYFGPYISTHSVKQALRLLRRIFPFAVKRTVNQKRATLHYHLGLDPGLEEGRTSLEDYRANLKKLMAVIQGKRKIILRDLEKEMSLLSDASRYEEAARVRNQIFALRELEQQVIFSNKEFLDISKDHALNEIVKLFGLKRFPKRIEGYDISHTQGIDVTASMVVFSNGVSNKREYRKFKTKVNANDDFYNMYETILRRLSENNRSKWSSPDLIVVDGGKGQLDAAIRAMNERNYKIPIIGLAKREEQIVINQNGSNIKFNLRYLRELGGYQSASDAFILINLPLNTNIMKLLQRIRDESHRFALSYHSVLRSKRQTTSLLDNIPSVGPVTRKKLLKVFGSVSGIREASFATLNDVIGPKKAENIKRYL